MTWRSVPALAWALLFFWVASPGLCLAAGFPRAGQFDSRHREDQILIKPKRGTAPAELVGLHAMHRSEIARRFEGLGDIQVVRVPKGETVQSLIAKYKQSGLVEYAEPDFRIHLAATTPNDPRFLDGSLWALNNTGQNGGLPDADIDAPAGWDTLYSASNVVVAVIDTGVRATHEDLAVNMWANPLDGSHGLNALTGLHNPDDDNGHGTTVAGIIGAVGDNGKGVTGVAWRVRIMACKAFDSSGNTDISYILACMEFARTNGAHIINASWGYLGDFPEFSLSLSNAIEAARSDGILFVAAAGNDTVDTDAVPFYPASFDLDNIVSVAATTRSDTLYYLSNYGATSVDLAAPGLDILSTYFLSDSSYALDEGTSMAAPHVAGALALLRARYPAETHTQLISRLLAATDPLPSLAGLCVSGGRLNLRKTLGQAAASAAHLTALAWTNGAPFQLLLTGEPERAYIIEAAANLTSWTAVHTNTAALDGTYSFSDSGSTNHAPRFYRARSVP